MARNIKRIAKKSELKSSSDCPTWAVALWARCGWPPSCKIGLQPGRGERPGRPSVPSWTRRPKVPMSEATERRLAKLAKLFSDQQKRPVTPMQAAAQLFEAASEPYAEDVDRQLKSTSPTM